MKSVYFIGIGGIGMSALARYFLHEGAFVAGYDRAPSKITKRLQDEGALIHFEDMAELIPAEIRENRDSSLVIYTPAVPSDHKELTYLKERSYKIVKRANALGEIAASKTTLAVAGTHGKTSTTTMLTHIMTSSGIGCTAFLGGISKNYGTNLILSKSDYLVAEADEFDRSFLQLWPSTAIITSTDADHLDIYNNHQSLIDAFRSFSQQIISGGNLILKAGIPASQFSGTELSLYRYSIDDGGDFFATDITPIEGGYYNFTLNHPKGSIEGCRVGIPGRINIENGIAAAAAALLNGVSEPQIKEALATFKGVERRFDIHINTPSIAYIDDYAHHPKEIATAINSIRGIYPERKLTGIFQPHLYTRTRDFMTDFAESLDLLDQLLLMEIYPAREQPIEGISSQAILNKMRLNQKSIVSKETLLETIRNIEPDVLITFGAGDIDRFIEPITDLLKSKYNV